jgi:hypothetical protein
MDKNKKTGAIYILIGLILLLLSIFLDDIGIGQTPGFGLGQIAGTFLGSVIIIYGIIKAIKK